MKLLPDHLPLPRKLDRVNTKLLFPVAFLTAA